MSKLKDINIELERLRSLFSSVDETKTQLVDNLLEQAAKYYTKLINSNGTVIKTLNSIMGKNVIDGDDAFDEFLKKANI